MSIRFDSYIQSHREENQEHNLGIKADNHKKILVKLILIKAESS